MEGATYMDSDLFPCSKMTLFDSCCLPETNSSLHCDKPNFQIRQENAVPNSPT